MIDQVHDVLLALCRVCQVLVVTVLAQIISVSEDAGFDVAGDAQHAVLLQFEEGLLIALFLLTLDLVVEVDLELGPACVSVEHVDLFAERCRVLVTFLKVVWGQANQVNLQGHSSPLF